MTQDTVRADGRRQGEGWCKARLAKAQPGTRAVWLCCSVVCGVGGGIEEGCSVLWGDVGGLQC